MQSNANGGGTMAADAKPGLNNAADFFLGDFLPFSPSCNKYIMRAYMGTDYFEMMRKGMRASLRQKKYSRWITKYADKGNLPPPLCLTIDIGSSSIRCSAYGMDTCQIVPGSCVRVRLQAISADCGVANLDKLAAAVDKAIDRCLAFLRLRNLAKFIVAVGFDCFVMNWVGVDAAGEAVTPVYTYADRHPGTPLAAAELRKELDDAGLLEATYKRCGVPIHPSYAPAQMRRLMKEEPETFAR
jgi:hypothetical protein